MLKIRSIIPVAALALLAACGGEEAEVEPGVGEVDAAAEPAPGAVVTPPVTTVPAAGDTMATGTMPMDSAAAGGTMAPATGDSAAM